MRTSPEPGHHSTHSAAPRRSRRTTTKVVLGVAVTGALVASGIAVATANAAETVVPGRLQAESYAAQSGAQVEGTGDADGGKNVGWLADGDWLRFDGVDLGAAGPLAIGARIASQNTAGGAIELRVGSQTGAVLATIPVASTGGWQTWATRTATAATHPAGKQTVFAVMTSKQAGDFVNLNWFTFGATAAPAPSGTTAAPTAPAPSASTGTPPAAGNGWVPVDRAKWDAQLAEYNALQAKPVPAGNVRVPEFNASCTVSHRLPDDPIVFPNMAAASHLHTFWGNKSTSATSTNESLMASTASSCKPDEDHSAYWVPTLKKADGTVVDPHGVTVYYGSRLKNPEKTVPFPAGFRMIVGDAKKQVDTPDGAPGQFWCAGAGGQIGRSADGNWPICAKTAEITYHLTFPDCWDGVHIDSPDHKSHVGGTGPDGTCASGKFPVAIPNVAFVIGYPASGDASGFALSSGKASSMHGDFMNAWQSKPLAERVKNCITQRAKCDSFGRF